MEEIYDYQKHVENAIDWIWTILPNLLFAIALLVLGIFIIRFVNRIVRKIFQKRDYDPSLESFLQSFINISLKLILFVLVVTQLGVQSSSLVAIIGAAGLAIGLALQGSLSNFAGGVLILVFKPFKVGDFITAQGVEGTIKEVSIFTTKLNTFGNQVAIIPNGQLSNNTIINYNEERTRRNKINVGISYESNIKIAKDILLNICKEKDIILEEPTPEVYVGELGDSSVNLTLRYWALNENHWLANFHVLEELKFRFDEAHIEIPFPQRVITMKESDSVAASI